MKVCQDYLCQLKKRLLKQSNYFDNTSLASFMTLLHIDFLDLECWKPGLCNGVLIREVFGVDKSACVEESRANDNCTWFTHDSDEDLCLLFQDCSDMDTSCDTCVSSQVQCSYTESDNSAGMHNYHYTKLKFNVV